MVQTIREVNNDKIDINVTLNGVVITTDGEPVLVRPRTVMLTLQSGKIIDLLSVIKTIR
jgi:hypothetical protein